MEKGKVIHIINTIIFFVLVIFFSFFTVALAMDAIRAPETNSLLSLIALIPFLFYLVICFLYVKAFRLTNLNNNWFKAAFILNFLSLLSIISIFLIATFFLEGKREGLEILGLIYFVWLISWFVFIISIIIFLIGYVKNRKR